MMGFCAHGLQFLAFPLGHEAMFEAALHHPYIRRIGHYETYDNTQRHDAPEQEFGWLHRAHVAAHHEKAHDRAHASHHEIHADEFRQETLADILPIAAAHHPHHEQRLENEEPEGEACNVFDDQVDPHGQAEDGGDCGRKNDPRCIAGNTMDGRADTLLPQWLRKAFMLSRTWLLVGQDIDEQS
jgi:hypothetical protein